MSPVVGTTETSEPILQPLAYIFRAFQVRDSLAHCEQKIVIGIRNAQEPEGLELGG